MKRIVVWLVVLSILAVGLTACTTNAPADSGTPEASVAQESSGTGDVSDESQGEQSIRIALINPYVSLGSYQTPFVEAAQEKGESMGAEVVLFDSEMSGEKQYDQAKQAIAEGYDGIFIVPLDPATGAKIVQICNEANVPIASSTTDVDVDSRDLLDVRVGISGEVQGETIAKYVVDAYKDQQGPIEAVLITGTPDAEVSQSRTAGFKKGIEGSNIEIVVEQSADFDKAKALAIMENVLVTNPDVKIVFAHDDQMAAGAVEAIEAAGKMNDIIVTGIGGNAEGLQMVKDGKIFVSFIQEPDVEASLAVEALVKIIKGEAVTFTEGNYIELPRTLITKENADEFNPKW